jgi:hypothetical protein
MNYKQCLFFVAKCLTLDQHPERIAEIKETINSGAVNWEKVIKLSSGQFVLPAMYLQLKRNGILPLLPDDLVEYLEEITDLNRKRNRAILEQAKEITEILNTHQIYPVFLKGVAHLLAGLYIDIAERMIGDIDFLVPEDKMVEAADLLIKNGYTPAIKYNPAMFAQLKHFPRLQNYNKQSSVEIHKEILNPENQKLIRGYTILRDKQPLPQLQNKAFIPSNSHQIIHNVFNAQLNDDAYRFTDTLLRQMYDLILLSLKENMLEVAKTYDKKFKIFNAYFATVAYIFSNPKEIKYQKSFFTELYIKKLNFFFSHSRIHKFYRTINYLYTRFSRYVTIPINSIYQKDTRQLFFNRISNKEWYKAHLKSYGKFFNK